MDEYSHEQNPTHSEKFPDPEEVNDVTKFILETMKSKDRDHYRALENSLNN